MEQLSPDAMAGATELPSAGPTQLSATELEGATDLPPAAAPSTGEALLRGGGQGLTLGFADEIMGLGKALFGGKDHFGSNYRAARDSERDANRAAQQAHPLAYGAAEVGTGIASSFIPGLGIAKGAGVLKTALGAAKSSAVAGAGYSEAEDAGGVATDALKSGALGGATAGVLSRVLSGAPDRTIRRVLGDVTDGSTATMRDRVVGKAGDRVPSVLRLLRETPFKRAGRDAGKLLTATEDAIADTGQRLDSVYARAGAKAPSIPVKDILKDLGAFTKQLEGDPGKAALARQVRALTDDVVESWTTKTGGKAVAVTDHVSAQQVRVLASDIADAAFRGSPAVSPKAGQATAQQIWGKLKDRIETSLETGSKGASEEVRALNRRMSDLYNVRESVRYRATREATESTRLKDRISGGLDIGLALAEPSAFVAKKAYDFVGKPAIRGLDSKLADLVTAARNGSTAAQIGERALILGFSPVVASGLASWAQKSAQDLSGESPGTQ